MSEGAKQQAAQLRLLIHKNLKVAIRGWYWTIILLILPAIFLLLFWVMQSTLFPSVTSGTNLHTLDLNVIPPCTTLLDTSVHCITIGYAPTNETIYPIMKILADQHQLSIAPDPKNLTKNYDIVGFDSEESITYYVKAHPNTTQAFVLFNSPTSYGIIYQSSWTDMFYGQTIDDADISAQVQVALDQAILTWTLRQIENDQAAEFKLDVQRQLNVASGDFMAKRAFMWSTFGVIFLYVGMIVYAFNLSSKIHEERSLQLVHGLKVAGMLNGPFWMSWFLTYALYSLISCILVVVLGLALQINYFVYCNFVISVLTLWLGYLATISFVLWLSSWIHRPVVNSLLLSFFALIQTGMVWLYGWSLMAVQVMYSSFGALPSFLINSCSFGGLFSRINSHTSAYGDNNEEVQPKFFSWSDLYDSSFSGDQSIITPNQLMFYLLGDIIVALFFAWHFDYVWPGKYGIPKRMFFFFSPTFWGLSKSESIIDISTFDASKINSVVSDLDPHINAENEFAVRAAKRRDPDVLLKVLRLSKTFKKGRSADAQDARALDMVSLAGTKNSILCILGHNGAGKTTLLNLLTGVFAPSYGEAFIGDASITDSIDAIRNKIGVCSQEDILWPKLTAREHLELFGTLKRVPRDQLAASVDKHLQQVGLTFAADRLAVTFSGGMKRRLSVAISNLGNPAVIFLDEPTTGLDPSNKRQLWDVIEEMKKDRLIVLTTHSMAEADHLGDKIAILALGRLRAIGSSLHLKNQFGVGYHLNLVCNEPQDVPAAKQKMEEFFPMAVLETESANNLSYSITQLRVEQLSPFLSWVENEGALERKSNNSNNKAILLDWGLSQTTLEEVFLRVTHGNSSLHGDQNGEEKDNAELPAQRELKIVLGEDYTNPLGSILIDASTTAHECRELIEASPGISKSVESYSYSILFNGVPLKLSEEHSTKATDFLPLMALQVNAKQVSKAMTVQQYQQLAKQHEELLLKYQSLVQELEFARESLQELAILREECERYKNRIQELESKLRPTLSDDTI